MLLAHTKSNQRYSHLLFGDVNHQIVMNLESALKFIPDVHIDRLIIELNDDIDSKTTLASIKKTLGDLSQTVTVSFKLFRFFRQPTASHHNLIYFLV